MNTVEAEAPKKAKVVKKQQLSDIKFTGVFPKDSTGKDIDMIEVIPVVNGREKKYNWSWIKENPVLAINADSRLARLTNATKESIEKIAGMHPVQIQKSITK